MGMSSSRLVLAAALFAGVGHSAEATTRVLLKDPAKTGGVYPATWEAQADYWEGGAPVSGYDYLVPTNRTLRVPATTASGTHEFPGDSLTVEGSTLAYVVCFEPAIISFKRLLFKPLVTTKTANPLLGSWSSSSYYDVRNKKVRGTFSHLKAPVTVEGTLNVRNDTNSGAGMKWSGSLTGDSSALINLTGTSGEVSCWGETHHFRLESDTSAYQGTIKVSDRATLITRGLANGSIVVNGSSVLQPIDTTENAMTVKNLTMNSGSSIAIPVSGLTGENGSIKVTGAYAKTAMLPVIVTVTNTAVATTTLTPNTKLKVLTVPLTSTLRPDDYDYYGMLTELDPHLVRRPLPAAGTFTVETNATDSTQTLYLNVKRRVNNLVSQTGSVYWDAASNWSDGKVPDQGGDYYLNGKGFRMRGFNDKIETFTGNSLTMDGKWANIQVRSTLGVSFPNVGIVLEGGSLYNYCGGGNLANRRSTPIYGNVLVTSTAAVPVNINPANNAWRGFNFPEGYTFSGPSTNATVIMYGSYNSTDDRRSFMQYEFNADTTGYCGTFDVRTNAVLVLGSCGLTNGTVHVTGGTYHPAAGAIAAMGPNTNAVVKNLKMLTYGAIEVRMDETGACGKLRVTDSYRQDGLVQVWLSSYPRRTRATNAPNYTYEVLTVAKGAGDLDASKFTFAGVIDGRARRIASSSFSVETAENGDRTLVLTTVPKGSLVIVR